MGERRDERRIRYSVFAIRLVQRTMNGGPTVRIEGLPEAGGDAGLACGAAASGSGAEVIGAGVAEGSVACDLGSPLLARVPCLAARGSGFGCANCLAVSSVMMMSPRSTVLSCMSFSVSAQLSPWRLQLQVELNSWR